MAAKIRKPAKNLTWVSFRYKTSISPAFANFAAEKAMKELILDTIGNEAFAYVSCHCDLGAPDNLTLSTTSVFNIEKEDDEAFQSVVNLRRINDIQNLNEFFASVNHKLKPEGLFIGFVETYVLRKKRILKKYPPGLNYLYYSLDFIVKRVFPKLRMTRRIYFYLTRGNNRVLSRAETFGRLTLAGFLIEDARQVGKFLFFLCRKEREPGMLKEKNTGILIRLPRIGKDGKVIEVYKLRTMHAYSEYLQDYVYNLYALKEGGKLDRDFRISTLGRIMRRFWIDEIPMLINLLRGEMKLIGVRPLSQHFFELYHKDLKQKRIKNKPGLIPPYYADLPSSLEEIMESEMRYLEAYERHPWRTDLKYFGKALYNILFRRARSA